MSSGTSSVDDVFLHKFIQYISIGTSSDSILPLKPTCHSSRHDRPSHHRTPCLLVAITWPCACASNRTTTHQRPSFSSSCSIRVGTQDCALKASYLRFADSKRPKSSPQVLLDRAFCSDSPLMRIQLSMTFFLAYSFP